MTRDGERRVSIIAQASPCSEDWDRMTGTGPSRMCGKCNKLVHNFSLMTAAEITQVVRSAPGGVCVKLYRRADDTILTADCPVGLAWIRWRVTAVFAALLAFLVRLGIPMNVKHDRPNQQPTACSASPTPLKGKDLGFDGSLWTSLRGNYLGSAPQDPGQGNNSINHYKTTSGGNGIRATIHGEIQ